MKKQPTQSQARALVKFADAKGRCWKRELGYCWETGNYALTDDVGSLQQVRNTLGPSWLVRVKLEDLRAQFESVAGMIEKGVMV